MTTFELRVLSHFRDGLDTYAICFEMYPDHARPQIFEHVVLAALHRARQAERQGRAA